MGSTKKNWAPPKKKCVPHGAHVDEKREFIAKMDVYLVKPEAI
jgi:hypothetical protein